MLRGYNAPWLAARALFAAAVLGASVASAGGPWTVEGRVVALSDGDTITVLDASKNQHKIRLAGIDAPEKRQAFGDRSRDLSQLVFGEDVRAAIRRAVPEHVQGIPAEPEGGQLLD
jgi:endonuclease YncB( thermonuclease family)